jgi:N-methylhydantoinase B
VRVRNLVEGKWNFEQVRRHNCPPAGLWGGKSGTVGDFLLRLPGENEFKSTDGSHYPVPAQAEVIVRTGGGGGWGNPLARDPDLVRSDAVEAFITHQSAREDYGVVLHDDLSIDRDATARLRAAIRNTTGAAGRFATIPCDPVDKAIVASQPAS